MQDTFDYIIIGAGSAGCVLANRLSEDPGASVLVLEFGGSDRSIFIQMPSALSIPMNGTKYNWRYETIPEPGLNGRQIQCPRGKVLGGSSSINGLVYMRGHACDFDDWESQGARGWGYSNCLPYFQRAESWAGGGDSYRGAEGPLATNAGNNMANPLYRAFVDAGHQAGYIKTEDPNGYMQEGFGPMHMTVKDGVRWSTANAYLRPAMPRPNLKVITRVMTHRIILEDKRAVGTQPSVGKAPWPSSGRWPKRALGAAQIRDRTRSFRSFESNTRHQGDRIWQRYTATSSSGMQFASRCCQTNANQSLFPLPHHGVRRQEGRATRREQRRGSVCSGGGSGDGAPSERGCGRRRGRRRTSARFACA